MGKRAGCRQTPQAEINAALIAAARDGKLVVRLKGGDPFVFGRGGEELHALLEAGIAVNVVPGVSAATAAPALAGIPLTHRDVAASLAVVTAQLRDGLADQRLEQIAASVDTLVVLMPLGGLEAISARLARVLTAERPAALIAAASTPRQRTVVGVLADISAQAHHAGLTGPATLVVGEVVRLQSSWSSAVRNRDATAARQTSRSGSIVSGRL